MAGFKAHMTGSTLCGIGYGVAGYAYGVPGPTCAVAGLACSVSGMLPDLDSASGKPAREILGLLAAVVPALMIPRFRQLGLQHEQAVLAIAASYLFIRFVVGAIFRNYTVHRGMWHSIPAAAVAGLLAFILVHGDSLEIRLFKACSVVLGFLCHLVMDEIWSVDVRHGIPRFKSSFGTALKFFTTNSLGANVLAYGQLLALLAFVVCDPYLMNQIGVDRDELPQSAQAWFARAAERGRQVYQTVLSKKGFQTHSPASALERWGSSPAGQDRSADPGPFSGGDRLQEFRTSLVPALPDNNGPAQLFPPPISAAPPAESAMRPRYDPAPESPARR
jgi:membrane-bound metal-dependent hydrolase YbcI (DUF457 family)